jgi:hypothetical protein
LPDAPIDAYGGVLSPGRTNGAVIPESRVSLVWLEE